MRKPSFLIHSNSLTPPSKQFIIQSVSSSLILSFSSYFSINLLSLYTPASHFFTPAPTPYFSPIYIFTPLFFFSFPISKIFTSHILSILSFLVHFHQALL